MPFILYIIIMDNCLFELLDKVLGLKKDFPEPEYK